MPSIRALAAIAVVSMFAASPLSAQVTVKPTELVADRLLAAHNAERVRLGLKPLVWSAKLTDHAKKWAQTLAVSDMFEHAPVGADGGEGENLWYGSKGDYSPEEMIGFFVGEGHDFKRGKFPNVSTTGVWEDVAHYTQIVWKDTKEVGCTVASNRKRDFLVCRYWPAGNIQGQPVYDYAATKAAVAPPAARPASEEIVEDEPPAHEATTKALAVQPAAISQPEPKKRASKKRRPGG